LFASADPVFHNVVGSIADVDFGVIASHVVLIGLGATLAAGYFWGAVIRRGPLPVLPGGQDLSLGIVPTGTALGLLDLLFLVFVVIQLRYFFGGAELIERTIGLTYAEYARRGFFELVTASALVLPILVGGDWALRPFDAAYAASLGADAVPDLLAAFARLGDQDKCRAAAALLARWTPEGSGGKRPAADGWRNWNLARARARRAVHEHAALLKATPCPESRPPTG